MHLNVVQSNMSLGRKSCNKERGERMKNKSLFGRIDVHLLGKTGRLVLDLDDVEG